MSADNHAQCPKCWETAQEAKRALVKKMHKEYGKLPIDKFQKLYEEAHKTVDVGQTLREYIEMGIMDGGTFYASYSSTCNICDFSYKYEHEVAVIIE